VVVFKSNPRPNGYRSLIADGWWLWSAMFCPPEFDGKENATRPRYKLLTAGIGVGGGGGGGGDADAAAGASASGGDTCRQALAS
jgi:hypothetical protein